MDPIFHAGLLAGRLVVRKCGLSKSEAKEVRWDRQAPDHFEASWGDEDRAEFRRGFDEGVEEGLSDMEEG